MSSQIEPIDTPRQHEAVMRTAQLIREAGEILNRELPIIAVRFDLSGSCAGMFCSHSNACWIRFNPWLFAKDWARHSTDTIAHEVAHYGMHKHYGYRRVKPHGPEWRALAQALGSNGKATFVDDLEGVPIRRQQRHAYACSCRTHWLSTTRHKRVQGSKARYHCVSCREPLDAL